MKPVALMLLLLALAGCEPDPQPGVDQPHPGTPDRPASMALPPVLYVDNETGCHYLSTHVAEVLVPRMGRDGKQVCGPVGGAP